MRMFDVLIPYTGIVLAALTAVLFALLLWVIRLEMRLRTLTRGKHGASLEEVISGLHREQEAEEAFRTHVKEALQNLHQRMRSAARGISTLRFDAFAGTGSAGKQSFATAVISETGDGVVFSSLHARESTRMFAKPVAQFSSEHELTNEEREALARAQKQIEA